MKNPRGHINHINYKCTVKYYIKISVYILEEMTIGLEYIQSTYLVSY